jgi:hypothetical protein
LPSLDPGVPESGPAFVEARLRALALLADSPWGRTMGDLHAHGFPKTLLDHLLQNGLARAHVDTEVRGPHSGQDRLTITEAGWREIGAPRVR